MELRSTEQETEELSRMYASLCQDDNLKKVLPPLSNITTTTTTTTTDTTSTEGDELETPVTAMIEVESQLASQVLATLESLSERIANLKIVMERFRERCGEKDAVTDKPRYGEKTLVRVQALIKLYDELKRGVNVAFGVQEEEEEESQTTKQEAMVELIRQQAQQEKELAEKEERVKQEELDRQEKERKAEEERRLEEQRQVEEEARLVLERQQAEIVRRAEEARQAERRVREEAERVDREWTNSIAKGSDGVREQLKVLKESTADDLAAQKTAINALHTLFSQITAHPEEVNFRRIRRDHPRFNNDIGRHKGGSELLIAAGFVLGAIDDVPSYISKEPNLEKDMDGWSLWFDLLKATLNIIEEELIK
jgi:hypothetical protein